MWDHIINIQVSYCIQKPKSLELMNFKKKILKMNNLQFLPNNIFIRFFEELKNNI